MPWALLVQTQFPSSMFFGVNEHFSETGLEASVTSDSTDGIRVLTGASLMDMGSL